jgi:hypothetical protein
MEEIDEDGFADVAFGLFEIFLNKRLQEQGTYLFELVESGKDFSSDFNVVYDAFSEEYPQLADVMEESFSGREGVYLMLVDGEGTVPTSTHHMYWIIQDAPGFNPATADDEKMGKWLIFLPEEEEDDLWRAIRDETCKGALGVSARVSTVKPNPESRDDRKVIYVYTPFWEDEADVMRVRDRLREIGVEQRIGYKRNIETYQGEYSEKGKKVTFYSA